MADANPRRALLLSDQCDFTLLHCGQPMRAAYGRSTWLGKYPEGSMVSENRYRCDPCGASLNLKIEEPDRPPPASAR